MTSADKQKIAKFLDLSDDFLGSGYRSDPRDYQFEDTHIDDTRAEVKSEISGDSIDKIANEIRACKDCALCEKRLNAAPGEGVLQPVVMVIGEGPGEDEDKQGRPFVGRAGQLLDKMLASIDLSRATNCFIANVVKCRPPNNRDPRPEETSACAHFLERQILLLKPKFILAAGRVAAQTLFNTTEPIGKMRGKFSELNVGAEVFTVLTTYHPAALLRNEELKRPAWEDLKLLKLKIEA